MTRATLLVITSLVFVLGHAVPALAQNDGQNERLAPQTSADLAVPVGWLGSALTAHDGRLWIGAQSVREPSILLQFGTDGELRAQLKTASSGNVGGIAFDGEGLCNLNYSTNMNAGQRMLERFGHDGTARRASVQASGEHNTFGLAWHGDGFFQGQSPVVRQSSVIHRLDADGNRLSSHAMPFYTRGMTWHDGELWVTTGSFHTLHVLDRDLNVVRSYQLSVALADIAFVDDTLYGLEQNRNRLHRFSVPRPDAGDSVLTAARPAPERLLAGWL